LVDTFNFSGVYLQGSFAVGDFDEHSDVDFVVVVERALHLREVEDLQVMHGELFDSGPEWAKHAEGIVVDSNNNEVDLHKGIPPSSFGGNVV
jgi:predicted nucleotidyltransferase